MLVLALVDLAALVALHHLGPMPAWSDLPVWLSAAPLEDLIGLLARVTGLVIGYWVALSLTLVSLGALVRNRTLVGLASRLVLPVVRPLAERALVVALAAAPSLSAAQALAAPPRPVEVLPPYVPTPAGLDEDESRSQVPDIGLDESKVWRTIGFGFRFPAPTYIVRKGDNLWKIARATITERTGDPDPTSAEIVPYWRNLIELNRDRLRSGDPDLIYPGEELLLP